jgi:sugar O-acyltransferase (sialic acid O-acetyltransferase NeuD family)
MNKLAVIGSGGFGSEVKLWALQSGYDNVVFYVSDEYCKDERPLSTLPDDIDCVIAIGNPQGRKNIGNNIDTLGMVIHPTAITNAFNKGMILCPYAVITINVKIGIHLHMNLHSDIGHDCVIGNYVTLAPGARISGKCQIGDCVYIGTNAMIREGTKVCDNVTIGAGSVVLKDITEPGVYVGIPAKKIK